MFNKLSKGETVLVLIGLILVLIVLIIIEGWVVASLWNWLMPTIFGLTTITTWQGVGILALCNLLFKSYITNTKKSS